MSCQDINDCLDFIRNCDEGNEIIQELIRSDYRLDEISDFFDAKVFEIILVRIQVCC
jgi:methyl coenzyme M reductase subunit C-like uncharacterized protein (methanogenesis marker protein 7)